MGGEGGGAVSLTSIGGDCSADGAPLAGGEVSVWGDQALVRFGANCELLIAYPGAGAREFVTA